MLTEPNVMHPRTLKELTDVVAKPLLVIFERPQKLGEVPVTVKMETLHQFKKKSRKEDPRI